MASGRRQALAVAVIGGIVLASVLVRADTSGVIRSREPIYAVLTKPGASNVAIPRDRRVFLAVTNPSQESRVLILRRASSTIAESLAVPVSVRPSKRRAISQGASLRDLQPHSAPSVHRSFVVHTGGRFDDARFFRPVTAELVAWDERVAVYRSPDAPTATDRWLDELLECFKTQSDKVSGILGSRARDVDGDGRFAILLVPPKPRPAPIAYVRPADFQSDTAAALSNHADVLYLSASPPVGADISSLLAHEYAHAVLSLIHI